jgi:hypothetical protein
VFLLCSVMLVVLGASKGEMVLGTAVCRECCIHKDKQVVPHSVWAE